MCCFPEFAKKPEFFKTQLVLPILAPKHFPLAIVVGPHTEPRLECEVLVNELHAVKWSMLVLNAAVEDGQHHTVTGEWQSLGTDRLNTSVIALCSSSTAARPSNSIPKLRA